MIHETTRFCTSREVASLSKHLIIHRCLHRFSRLSADVNSANCMTMIFISHKCYASVHQHNHLFLHVIYVRQDYRGLLVKLAQLIAWTTLLMRSSYLYRGPSGDLYVYLDIVEIPEIQRDGINLLSTISISYLDAILGTVMKVLPHDLL